jgi:hypothetical protein
VFYFLCGDIAHVVAHVAEEGVEDVAEEGADQEQLEANINFFNLFDTFMSLIRWAMDCRAAFEVDDES